MHDHILSLIGLKETYTLYEPTSSERTAGAGN